MLAELGFYVPAFNNSKLSVSSEAEPRGSVFPPALSFLYIPKRGVCLRTGKTATLTCEISLCLFSVCPSVLSASVGLKSGYFAQSGSLGKAGSCF